MKSSKADIFLKFSFWYLWKKAKTDLDWQRWVNDDIFNFEVNNSLKTKISEKTNPSQNQTHQCLNSLNKCLSSMSVWYGERSLNCTHLLHWSYLMQNKAGPLTSLASESFSCIDCAVWVFVELTPHEILLWRRVCLSRCTLGQRLNEIGHLRVTYWHFLWTSTVPHGQSSNKYELYFDWSELWIDLGD